MTDFLIKLWNAPQTIAGWVWRFSEWSGIPLGRAAPHIFGLMMGAKSWRRK